MTRKILTGDWEDNMRRQKGCLYIRGLRPWEPLDFMAGGFYQIAIPVRAGISGFTGRQGKRTAKLTRGGANQADLNGGSFLASPQRAAGNRVSFRNFGAKVRASSRLDREAPPDKEFYLLLEGIYFIINT
jgi:hypothetical protein